MRVILLSEFGKNNFVDLLSNLSETSTDKNKDWFPALLKDYELPKYLEWFFVIDDDRFVAFSTIQNFNCGTYRLLTRCYIDKKYRRLSLPKVDTYASPGTYMIQEQLKFLNYNYNSIFISLEHIRRRRTIINMSKKMTLNTGVDWEVANGMFLTCNNRESEKCWQNICYSKSRPQLDSITYNEWTTRYGKMSH